MPPLNPLDPLAEYRTRISGLDPLISDKETSLGNNINEAYSNQSISRSDALLSGILQLVPALLGAAVMKKKGALAGLQGGATGAGSFLKGVEQDRQTQQKKDLLEVETDKTALEDLRKRKAGLEDDSLKSGVQLAITDKDISSRESQQSSDDLQKENERRQRFMLALASAPTQKERDRLTQIGISEGFIEPGSHFDENTPQDAEIPTSQEDKILADTDAAAQRMIDNGAPPTQAYARSGEAYKAKRSEIDRQYKRIDEADKASTSALALANELEDAVNKAGDTGYWGEAKQKIAGLLSFASTDQANKYTAGQKIEGFQTKAIEQIGPTFKGPMSDKDVAIMLRAYTGLDKTPQFNKDFAQKVRFTGQLQSLYVDFMREQQANGVPVRAAEATWKKYRDQNPYLLPSEDGGYVPNPVWKEGISTALANLTSDGSESGSDLKVGGTFQGKKILSIKKIQ